VREATELLLYHRISGLPVLDGAGALVGIVSEADLLAKGGTPGATVGDIMTRTVITVDAGARLEEIAAIMTRERVKRVPVLEAGRLVGILSRADLVRWMAG
jgi:CBS domain-containing protein